MVKNFVRSINTLLTRMAEVLVGTSFLVLIVAVTIQVLGRSSLFDSPVWTEELTRFALLYLTAFGVGLSFIRGDLVNVDIICEALPRPLPWILRLISAIIVAGLSSVLISPAYTFTSIGKFQTSPALGWRMDFIHASVLVLLAFLLVFALIRITTLFMELTGNDVQDKEAHT
ncbi:TRAP transporter small permease [Desulfogranum japonicum]|uniref:TRAP transporter small permease n=1 Tax=Desulfogranum japonicum TaxID=231447 RepID=UPI0004047253|nr:TRAP transporter small permease subunit [Desulfogranum japonicum]